MKMIEVKASCFLCGGSRFATMLLVQAMYSCTNLGNPDFCVQVFGKNRRQHSVILLINDGVKTFSVLRFG